LREGQTTELGTRDKDREVLRAVIASKWRRPAGSWGPAVVSYLPDGNVQDTDIGVVAKCELALLWTPEGTPTLSPYERPRLPVGASLHVFYPTLRATRDTWAIARIHALLGMHWCKAKSVTPIVVVFSPSSKAIIIQGFRLSGVEARLEEHKLRLLLARAAMALVSQNKSMYVPGEHCKCCVGITSCPKIVKMASVYLGSDREKLTEEDLSALREVGSQLSNMK
jgi:hypothetical protein